MEEFYLGILCNRVSTIRLGVEDKSSPFKPQVSYEIAVNGNSNCSGWKKNLQKDIQHGANDEALNKSS